MSSISNRNSIHTYEVIAYRDGRWWTLSIPELNGPSSAGANIRIVAMGQARTVSQLDNAAREVAALWLDVDETEIKVRVVIRGRGDGVDDRA